MTETVVFCGKFATIVDSHFVPFPSRSRIISCLLQWPVTCIFLSHPWAALSYLSLYVFAARSCLTVCSSAAVGRHKQVAGRMMTIAL